MEYPTTNGVTQYPTSAARLEVLNRIASELYIKNGKPLVILEIGSLYGDSAKILAKYGKVIGVDLWDYEKGLEIFKKNTEGLDIETFAGPSDKILPLFLDETFDLIYIDGCHTYPTVETDIIEAQRLVRRNGIICGDDLEKVITCSDDFYHAVANKFTDYIDGYHPGVTLAVHYKFDPRKVNMENGFWWVQC